MDRAQKNSAVQKLNADLLASEILLVVHHKGLTVQEATNLRREVRKTGANFLVIKNTLARLAMQETAFSSLRELFSGPTALAYAKDPVSIAKVLVEFSKKNEKLVVLGGAFGGQVLNQSAVANLASLPSLDELRSKIIGLLQAPAGKIARIMQAPGAQLARITRAHADKSAGV